MMTVLRESGEIGRRAPLEGSTERYAGSSPAFPEMGCLAIQKTGTKLVRLVSSDGDSRPPA